MDELDEYLEQCQKCGKFHDILQIRLDEESNLFYCDSCLKALKL